MMMRNDYLKQLVEDIHSTTVATSGRCAEVCPKQVIEKRNAL